jgi:putative endonuclease
MPKKFTSKNQKTGELGESVAVRYLEAHGYDIVERNYTKPCGEIDIVAAKEGMVHFIEVKAQKVSVHPATVTPAENLHTRKAAKLRKVIALYMREKQPRTSWQFDLAQVYLNTDTRRARVVLAENLII